MAVRKTESRLPAGMQATDLGHAVTSTNSAIHLVSFLADTVAARRMQNYVVFVTDAVIAPTVGNYDWVFNDGGTVHNLTTSLGFATFTPQTIGTLTVTVTVKNTTGAVLVTITMTQRVAALFNALEVIIDQQESNTPRAAHPETSREIVNDLRGYIDVAVPATDALNPLLLALAYGASLREPFRRGGPPVEESPGPRLASLELCASRLNENPATSFLADARSGIGVCQLRPHLLALYLARLGGAATYLSARTLRAKDADRRADVTQWETDFNALLTSNPTDQIDLFNLLRFPKTCFRVARTVLEGLVGTCFPSDTVPTVLANPTKTQKLIAQFRNGPVMPLTGLKLKGGDTRIQQFTLLPLWAVTPRLILAPIGGSAASSGAAPPAPVGSPEHIPEHTYIANFVSETNHPQTGAAFSPADQAANIHLNGFIRNAILYHETYSLFQRNVVSPNFIDSFEELIEKLSQLPASHLSRVRIVSHVYINDAGVDTNTNIMVPFFRNQLLGPRGSGHTLVWHFQYAISDEAGMLAYLLNSSITPPNRSISGSFPVQVGTQPDPRNPGQTIDVMRPVVDIILDILRLPANRGVLVPFRLTAAGGRPAGKIEKFVRMCCDLFLLANTTELALEDQAAPPLRRLFQRGSVVFQGVVQRITDVLATFTPTAVTTGITAQNLNDLRAAILARSLSEFPMPFQSFTRITFTTDDTSYLENHTALRNNLATVRNKFSKQSTVEIRGCRLGQDIPYTNGLQQLLGLLGDLPALSSPDWFQMFPTMGFFTLPDEANIDGAFQNGLRDGRTVVLTSGDVQREYSTWAGRMGIAAHLAFWQRLTAVATDPLEFLAYDWRNAIPGSGLRAVQLQGFDVLPFSDAIVRLSQVFNVPAASVPAPATVQAFTANLLPLAARLWHTATALTSLTASTPPAGLAPHLTELTSIAGAPAMAQTLPAAPSPLTLDYLNASVTQLKNHLTTQLNVAPFLTAIRTQLGAATAGIRYLLRVGLPLPVQRAAREIDVRLLLFDLLKDEATRNWMRSQWATLTPAAEATINGLTINWTGVPFDEKGTATPTDDSLTDMGMGLQTAALTDTRTDTPASSVSVCPEYEYARHIITVPATP